ncbi:MarR family winged helix-turn-helix transcriptional regulator [Streptomyces sp. NPDC096311]|uniref:MarR family winged helix-turn-helix transcriptional regulator n=1 Tax=Streptomyces sp. NPDC096311 TaxID=3366083 RepID=UPI00381F3462
MDDPRDLQEPRWLDADEQQCWQAFAYVLTLLPAALETRMHRDAGIRHFEFVVMSALSMAPQRTLRMSEVAQYTGSTLSRLSNVVSRLEKREWVRRSTDATDGRYTLATLTEQGQEQVSAATPAHIEEVRRLVFDPLTRGQQRQLDAAAQCILRALNAPCPSDWTLPDGTFPAARK